jgi:hypothetical protein
MSIEWTDEAVSAAWKAYGESPTTREVDAWKRHMRAALDAAVKAQGFEVMLWKKRKAVRAEAIEEAASYHERRVAELSDELRRNRDYPDHCAQLIIARASHVESAAAIRSLAKPSE